MSQFYVSCQPTDLLASNSRGASDAPSHSCPAGEDGKETGDPSWFEDMGGMRLANGKWQRSLRRFFESIWIERDAIFFSLKPDRNDNQYSNTLNIVQTGVILRVC
jgi:hypothetical protein